ncbi:hypothetical protein GCM10011519_23090 [Marmoricola endophyticus]|uniref:Quercetin 2,3-dioxygenase C-terminal cupin domain-containing protein n=1 Tax=Marmoricola endophyticus TaxID=2040280 RepID=A0A917F433_9ACTN|nr:hypothetical protein GCM10011519_23090 [Marmoricola endophyticus]
MQRLTAGSGVEHSEISADAEETTRFVQSWLRPSTPGLDPSYERLGGALVAGGEVLRPVDLGPGTAARLHLGQVSPGERTRLPQAPALHVLVVGGTATLTSYGEDAELRDGDAVRMRSVTEASVSVSPDASQAVSLVVWALP